MLIEICVSTAGLQGCFAQDIVSKLVFGSTCFMAIACVACMYAGHISLFVCSMQCCIHEVRLHLVKNAAAEEKNIAFAVRNCSLAAAYGKDVTGVPILQVTHIPWTAC